MIQARTAIEHLESHSSDDGELLIERLTFDLGGFAIDSLGEILKQMAEVSDGHMTVESIIRRYRTGHLQIWTVRAGGKLVGAFVGEIAELESGQIQYQIHLAAGNAGSGRTLDSACRASIELIEKFAKDKGCSKIIVSGRRGWGRALPGFKEVARVFSRDINHESEQ